MVAAMQKTGCQKPIFYNMSHAIQVKDAYLESNVQGGTFQWYPTRLLAPQELEGNLLPNVDRYEIPFAQDVRFKKMAKVVYEFDAADVGRSYIYPAMARSFRTAGIQWATHFSYDPTYIADVNTEYATHYMNLAYTPQKALSLKIASKVFHDIQLYSDYGPYPQNKEFGNFRVDYLEDLAEMVNETEFIYTNHTNTKPTSAEKLASISGWGNSNVVKYDGTGAYFLDKIEEGIWRLEVMPDVLWVRDPFGKTSPKQRVAVIKWKHRMMRIMLPDLGEEFRIEAINQGNSFESGAENQSFPIYPGTYLLVKKGVESTIDPHSTWQNISLSEFSAPVENIDQTYVIHQPAEVIDSGSPYEVKAMIASTYDQIESVELFFKGNGYWQKRIGMHAGQGFEYIATIPGSLVQEGFLEYNIVVKEKGNYTTHPEGLATHPWDWDYFAEKPYKVPVVKKEAPLYLFNAQTDARVLSRGWLENSGYLIPGSTSGKSALEINVKQLFIVDPDNTEASPIYDYSMRFAFKDKIRGRKENLDKKQTMVIRGKSLNNKPCKLQIALVDKNATAFGVIVEMLPDQEEYRIDLQSLKKVRLITLPRPYPTFLPYYFEGGLDQFSMKDIEVLQLSIGPGIARPDLKKKHGIMLESVRLE